MLNVDSKIVLCDLNNCCTDSVTGMQIMQRIRRILELDYSSMANLGRYSAIVVLF